MTRFARAKGSKASNEKLPEPATSWGDMKQELLNKKLELEEKKNRDKAMHQREANYQAFLQEKEDEEFKNISWADFPEANNSIKKEKHLKTSKKQKLHSKEVDKQEVITLESHLNNKRNKKQHKNDAESDEFLALKVQIDKVLENHHVHDSDSDAPPDEASVREKPQEIILKKTKKPKQKLQILINQKNKSTRNEVLQGKTKDIDGKKVIFKEENLTEKVKKKIQQKQERYKKQLTKKQQKRQEQKNKNETDKIDTNVNGLDSEKQLNQNPSEIQAKILEKKLERRRKQKEKKLKKKLEASLANTFENNKEDEVLSKKDLENIQKKKERRARQAEKRKKIREDKALAAELHKLNTNSEQSINKNDEHNNLTNNFSTNNNRKKHFQSRFDGDKTENTNLTEKKPNQKHVSNREQNKSKLKDKKDIQRKKAKVETMFINGKTIEIDYVDGFPVKKEDADRLKKLRKEMISKGLPRSEINISLKLERRRAEKAFAREKKNVCFNCRKSGHNLSECPELDKNQMAQTSGTGICFKCGSTEHTHFDCKVVKGLDYKFATCFICKEQGHISRQCPDNQRGLYPKGGACKVCGDVTHLKKDCPKYQVQQSQLQANLNIGMLDNMNPEDLGFKEESKNTLGPVKKLNKIKF